ncbi:C69 family dipeptidase, partial [Bombilactobacillus bombi]|uniref:C69 family dipeptidase n=1 Tax=Bombilactobacillus bombi TaxID=1303590 RepID=UPI0015E60839
DVLYSADLPQFIADNNLNPDHNEVNLRHIFGSATIKDTHYNNPRAWYVQKFFTPDVKQDPLDQNLPFICHANRKINIEELKWAMSSHYENTPYDRYGNGTDEQKTLFRPIGINRNEESHILQIRNNVPEAIAGIQWLGFGPNTFNTFVPFYTNVSDTPEAFRDANASYNPNTAYWLSRTLGVLGDTNYSLYSEYHAQFEQKTLAQLRAIVQATDKQASGSQNIDQLLKQANQQLSTIFIQNSWELLGNMVKSGSERMKLKFTIFD